MNQGAFIETRRFRVWEQEAQPNLQARWKVLLRYAIVRTTHTWYLSVLLALAAIGTIITLVSFSYVLLSGAQTSEVFLAAQMSFIWIPAVFLLLVGAPLIAEDVRFNAPLFYFSRPLRTADYLMGKCVHIFGLIVATGLIPFAIFCIMVLVLGVHDVPLVNGFNDQPRDPDAIARDRQVSITTIPEALYASFVSLLGFASVLFFITSAMIFFSSMTRRAWHAAMAFVAVLGSWSILGAFMTELVRGAGENLFGPAGWMLLVLVAPLEAVFKAEGSNPTWLQGAGWAVPVAHGLLIGMGVLALHLAHRRLRHLEEIL